MAGNIKGTKKFTYGRYRFNKKVFAEIKQAVDRAGAKSLETFAPVLLKYIADTEPEFNTYTGNLENSYAANIFIQRRLSKILYHDTGVHGTVNVSPSGARWVKLTKKRHARRTKELISGLKRMYYTNNARFRERRYLKKWEKEKGYARRNYHRGKTMYSAAKYGDKYAQNFLIIENQAPYAEWVQQSSTGTHRHYNVLRRSSVEKSIRPQATRLVKAFTRQELKKAGFDIR